ncbi:DNA-binding transcriptional regulator, LacI/PurR family [Nonomuraea solani]|uniref:DNA-binding transcriptional regulator, LacI/PurR family n=1 Tax=Nonomuraea solani TaxID=1144553 RepID=A0A1H6EBM3_9ACTN|nr:LacI family DNA-binding transcriptional regulator [Nonomuraea solani]SEG94439.1 DNA-binding transcriptional regulator, LacI/PurR family [Nonomuraea solani]
MDRSRVGLKDVARLAGVSVKTVSNVVNGYVHVTPATRTRVEAAIKELNYRPNLSARNLRQGRTGIIALAVPELDIPYFAELAHFVVACAEERGLTVLIDQTGATREREQLVAEGFRAHLIDGLIFSPLALTADDLAARVDDTPMVLLGERVSGGTADHIVVDNVAAARDATLHLASLGRRRIAAIGAQDDAVAETSRLRLAGYRQALKETGLPRDDRLVVPVEAYHRADGARAMAALLDSGPMPDAVFCFNDLLALGALRTLLERGHSVPGEVALAGFDDIEDGRYGTPTLTTISPDKQAIARQAVDLLADRMAKSSQAEAREIHVAYRLVIRESTNG